MTRIRAAVVGASGYIGGEVVRALLSHPRAELAAVVGNESAGKPLFEEQPYLRGVTSLVVRKMNETDWKGIDVVFLGLANGESMKVLGSLPAGPRVIDCSADFRLKDRGAYEEAYGTAHLAWDRVGEFVYGLPELFRDSLKDARMVAAPGCFATAAILGATPLALAAQGPIFISAVTGSSGSGAKPKDKAHHPFRSDSLFAYEPFRHRHLWEIRQSIRMKTEAAPEIVFQPHSGPFTRGIFATIFATLPSGTDAAELFRRVYGGERFIRLVQGSPNVKWVQGSNFADIGVAQEGTRAIVTVAIDNLVKGGGGQAVQCMNVMFGFPEDEGLSFWGMNP